MGLAEACSMKLSFKTDRNVFKPIHEVEFVPKKRFVKATYFSLGHHFITLVILSIHFFDLLLQQRHIPWKKRPFFRSNICDQDDQDSTSKMWSEDHVYQKSRVYDIHSNLVNIKTVQTVLRKLRCHERTSCVVGLQVFQEGSYLANLLQHRVQKLLQGSLGLPRSSD